MILTGTPAFQTVTNASANFSTTLRHGEIYVLCSNTNAWAMIGSSPTASAGAGSFFVPAGKPIAVTGTGLLAIIRDAADGKASLTPVLS